MNNNIPIIGQAQQSPTYPQINIQVNPQGVMFSIALGPTISINHLVTHPDMDNIEQLRRQVMKEMRENAEIMRNVMEGRR